MLKEIRMRIWKDVKEYWAAALFLAVYIVVVNLIFHNFCPMVIVSGLPCPGCGLTRSILYLISGRIQDSIYINPMGIPIACILAYFFINRYIFGRNAKGIMLLIVASIALLLVLYGIRMYYYFPNRVPYVYTEENILSKICVFYEEILHGLKLI